MKSICKKLDTMHRLVEIGIVKIQIPVILTGCIIAIIVGCTTPNPQDKLSPSVIPCKITELADNEWANLPEKTLFFAEDRTLWINVEATTSPQTTDRKIFKHGGQFDLYVEKKMFTNGSKWTLVSPKYLKKQHHLPVNKIILVDDINKIKLEDDFIGAKKELDNSLLGVNK